VALKNHIPLYCSSHYYIQCSYIYLLYLLYNMRDILRAHNENIRRDTIDFLRVQMSHIHNGRTLETLVQMEMVLQEVYRAEGDQKDPSSILYISSLCLV
jgi:hypothetical protein